MKKYALFLVALFLITGIAFSQQPKMHGADSSKMDGCMMGMGMGMMAPRVVATLPDGSVLVMSGHKLIKYDQNLNLVKQVTVPVDSTAMQQMKKMCPNAPGGQQPQTPPKQQPGTPPAPKKP